MMWQSMGRVAAATALFGVVHSALASRAVKRVAARVCGERNRNGWYRVFYIVQSLGTFTLLTAFIRRQPGRELYHIRGPWALAMHLCQFAMFGAAVMAAREVGLRRITGLESAAAWFGEGPVPPEPEAQGPALDHNGKLHVAGPFTVTRHPLNVAPVPIFWLWPRMTTNLFAFNTIATLYLILGSRHEEARLRAAYAAQYEAYQQSGIPFYGIGVPQPFEPPRQDISRAVSVNGRPRSRSEDVAQ